MEFLSINDILQVIRKSFLRILAISLAAGMIAYFVVGMNQTYTCTLGFRYNDAENAAQEEADTAAEDTGQEETATEETELVSRFDPYEIQNPVVIQGALEYLGLEEEDRLSVRGIRQDISISKVVTDLDQEVSESAALLGEKYEANGNEYEMTFTYDASLGDEFGPRMFSAIIQEYDEFLLDKYYERDLISDFAQALEGSSADYIDIATYMSERLESIIENLTYLEDEYPDFRSKRTGYSFAELRELYEQLRDVQYAKYYGNIRAGNLAKDPEMVIKGYQTRVKDLTETMGVDQTVADNYKNEITTFYDPYKEAGLYNQANQVQNNVDASNNRDQDVLYDVEEYINTYDNIILSYTEHASAATDAQHTIEHYNSIIEDFSNDTVSQSEKDRLLEKNQAIFEDILDCSARYSALANQTINEVYYEKINADLQYLILPEVTGDLPTLLIVVFVVVLVFGVLLIAVLLRKLLKNVADRSRAEQDHAGEKLQLDVSGKSRMQQLIYEQYLRDFPEFFLVYQPMLGGEKEGREHFEVFLRWRNEELGMVSPAKVVESIIDLGLFQQLNEWIIKGVCADIARMAKKKEKAPVVHINCPSGQVRNFALNDSIIRYVSENEIPAECVCLELEVEDIAAALEDITLLEKMGIDICIDKFENTEEEEQIMQVLEPKYIKMSIDSLHGDLYATSAEEFAESEAEMEIRLAKVIAACTVQSEAGRRKIKTCICGVETKAQDRLVTHLGFDYKQGFYYGKPEPLSDD